MRERKQHSVIIPRRPTPSLSYPPPLPGEQTWLYSRGSHTWPYCHFEQDNYHVLYIVEYLAASQDPVDANSTSPTKPWQSKISPGIAKRPQEWRETILTRLLLYSSASQGVVHRAAAAASPGHLLERQDPRPHPRPTKSESVFQQDPRWFLYMLKFEKPALQHILFLLANHWFQGIIWIIYCMVMVPLSRKWARGLPWWCSGWESACQYRGHGFKPWSGKIPHAAEQLGPWATTTEPARLEPVLCNKRDRDEEWPPLAATRESPRTETKTQHSHKLIN